MSIDAAARKVWATLQAQLALAGFRTDLVEADDGAVEMVVERWGQSRTLPNLDAAVRFVEQVAGRSARGDLHQLEAQEVPMTNFGGTLDTRRIERQT